MWSKTINKTAYKVKELYELGFDAREKKIIDSVLDSTKFGEKIINTSPNQVKNVAFIVPGIDRYSGGITSILRLGTYLTRMGYKIAYIDFQNRPVEENICNAKINLSYVEGKFETLNGADKKEFDVVIAGNWQAVYYLNDFDAYKMYFVQDYEPYFFKLNERYLLAKLTYQLGEHIVSLGKWNIEQISKECHIESKMDYISFPYEPSEYSKTITRDFYGYKSKKNIKIAVYTKEEGKRIPNILQSILEHASEYFAEKGIVLEIAYFGMKKNHKVRLGQNLGKLNKDQMLKLYNDSDFGMVASMTNISLVPYEMIATGLPVIEMQDGSFLSFFPSNSALLIDYNYKTLVEKIEESLKNPVILEQTSKNALKAIENLSWEKTAAEFSDILRGL